MARAFLFSIALLLAVLVHTIAGQRALTNTSQLAPDRFTDHRVRSERHRIALSSSSPICIPVVLFVQSADLMATHSTPTEHEANRP
jgi:hypothetical protein